jgi:PAS domain S-box-containing protein
VKIKTKILCTLLAMALLVALVGVLAVNRQKAAATISATKEAENVAHALGLALISDSNQLDSSSQEIVRRLHGTEGRDVVLVDTNGIVLADANPHSIGKKFVEDQHDEVAATIRDEKVRTFIELSADHPNGIRQIVAPVQSESGQLLGAVILEYTPLYNELMQLTKTTMQQIASVALGSVAIAFLIAFFMGRSIAAPLQQLTKVSTAFAAGKTDLPMPPPSADEIGQLAVAFGNMVQKRQHAEEALRHARDELEVRVTERTAELAKINESLRLVGSAVEQAKESILITDAQLDLPGPKIIFVNPAFTQMTGYTAAEGIGKTPRILQGQRTDKTVLGRLRQNLEHGETFAGEAINYRKDGTEFNLEWQIAPLRNVDEKITHFVAIQHDITRRKRLEAQLFQSQKMETVGKLAGGIAHEFNSILTAIIGQSELLLADLPPGNPLAKNAAEIRKASERAATLTHQLLAYGRKQILQPEILDLNAVVTGMENTLLHLMGRGVEVRFNPAVGLGSVKADEGQIEQVIVNISMNATEAMPNGGKLTIETANVTLDEQYVSRFPELKAGIYTMLAIGDTGAGMSEEIKARVFEPFFTTKGVGKGTGLGLATCHGIIKQSGGHIAIYSELGRGTTVKVYLPQVEQEIKAPAQPKTASDLPRGTETILLVEDDPSLREMACALLERLGYAVLTAGNGVEAMSFVHQQGRGHIDLLFTDVVMPHMSGKELADRIHALHPQTKILFTSAYTESAIVHQGVLNKGVMLLQKPFTPSALAHKLREVLDG